MASNFESAGYSDVPPRAAPAANRSWWDLESRDYIAEHGAFLGDADLVWGPEGISEDDAHHLGDVSGLRVLEVGCGGAQGGRWAQAAGADVVSFDLSHGMLAVGQELSERTDVHPQLVQADAQALPFADGAFDLAFSAYGAIPFVPDLERVHREVYRVLKPEARWVFATTHPIRWAFPDAPSEIGLTANRSYFDRTPYSERDGAGKVTYVEYHRTLSDHVAALCAAGFHITAINEPQWPKDNTEIWGGWSPLRGKIIPGTIIFSVQKPAN